jgi:hypothetical protein
MSMPSEYAEIYHERFKATKPVVPRACYTCASGKSEIHGKEECSGCYGDPGRPNWHRRQATYHAQNGEPLRRGIRVALRRGGRPGNGSL